MQIATIFLCTFLLTFSSIAATSADENKQSTHSPQPLYDVSANSSFFVSDRGLNGITLEVVLPPTASSPGSPNPGKEANSHMPYISRWVVIPNNVGVNLHVVSQRGRRFQYESRNGIPTYIDNSDIPIMETISSPDSPNPGTEAVAPAFIGNPATLRGIRMVPVMIFPVQKLENTGVMFENHEVTIELEFTQPENNTVQIPHRAPCSREFSNIIENLVVNPPARDLSPSSLSRILVVHNSRLNEEEEMMSDISAFAEWKRRLGFEVEVLPIEISIDRGDQERNQVAIKEAIRERYEEEESIEFLIIMGHYDVWAFGADSIDHPVDSPYFFPTFIGEIEDRQGDIVEYKGDQFLVTFDEDDNMPDVIVGRFMCTNNDDLSYALTRVIEYEQNPVEGEWYNHALFSSATYDYEENRPIPPSFRVLDIIQWTERRLRELGYDEVTNIFNSDFPEIGDIVLPILEDGVSLALSESALCGAVTFELDEEEGFYQIGAIANTGRKHPFVISNYSRSGSEILEPFFNSGSVDEPNGPVSAFGVRRFWHDYHLSHIIGWSVWGMKNLDIITGGHLFQFTGMQLHPIINYDIFDEAYRWYYKGFYQFLGDPTVKIRNAQPTQLIVNHPESFNIGSTLVSLTVNDGENPVGNAVVCIRQGEDLQFVEMSAPDGNVRFTVPDGLQEGELQITASKHNHIPYLSSPVVEEQDVNIVLEQFQFIDGDLTNGQTIPLELTFRNSGGGDANNLLASFSSDNDFLSFSADQLPIEAIEAGQNGELRRELQLSLDPDCPGGTLIQVRIDVNSGDSHWLSAFETETSGPHLVIEELGGQLAIGRIGAVNVVLANIGDIDSDALTAELTTSDPNVTITIPNRNYPAIGAGRSSEPNAAFSVRVEELFFPGNTINFELLLSDGEDYNAVVPFEFGPVGEVSPGDPLGPDDYGYICFDSSDEEWEDHPNFNWIEISSDAVDAEIPGTKIDFEIQDRSPVDVWNATEVIELPFTFQYYGTEYNSVSICTNGWISMGADGAESRSPLDWQIPGPGSTDALLNVYHTDLEVTDRQFCGVYYQYQEDESRFIVEWSELDLANRTNMRQHLTFQAILYDPIVYETPTGDGEIEFHYKIFGELDSLRNCRRPPSIGIGNSDGSDGLQYYNNFEFPPQAVQPENEFALKFTTAVQTTKGSVSGRIVQMMNPELGVSGASVDLHRIDEIETDNDGRFEIENIREGLYTATIYAPYYGRINREINLVGGEDIVLDPILLPRPEPHVEIIPLEVNVRPDSSRTRADVLLENHGMGVLEYSTEVGLADGRIVDYRSVSEFSINEIFGMDNHQRAYAPLYVAEQDLIYIPAHIRREEAPFIGVFSRAGELQRTIPLRLDDPEDYIRSLAWDGESLWGSIHLFNEGNAGRFLVRFDVEGAIVDRIVVPFDFYRSLPFVFSPGGETIYVTESEEDLLEMDREGNVLQTWQITFQGRLTEVTGIGYNSFDIDGMPLYLLEIGEENGVDNLLRFIKFNPENGDWKVQHTIRGEEENGEGDDAVGLRTSYGATVISSGYEDDIVSFVVVQNYGRSREANDMYIEREISPNIGFMVPGTAQNISGEVAPNSSVRLGFEVEGNGWPEGQYGWSYIIRHNAVGDSIVVPVNLTLDMESGFGQDKNGIPVEFGLKPVYPNPFNSRVTIKFGVDREIHTTLKVYDLAGRLVRILFDDTPSVGWHLFTWDGSSMSSGVYVLQLESAERCKAVKTALIR